MSSIMDKIIHKLLNRFSGTKQAPEDHFAEVGKMVSIGSDSEREIEDIRLTRDAVEKIISVLEESLVL